ncbi:Protein MICRORCHIDIA 6 [Dichanthelium oligosanthes]|uniref:Protein MICRORCHIDIA 6 n=1 Tax=Dichanthelium oligosanthes TaxID=888268 RepID=A0A1E5VAC6_9POAL|nr:Protein MICRORCHIDIA 6 [Dichanthelium oligosanthes]
MEMGRGGHRKLGRRITHGHCLIGDMECEWNEVVKRQKGEHLAYGQDDAAQGTTFLKQEFFADDGQAEAAQCSVTLQMQELRADDGQADAAQCTTTLQMQEHIGDDGQGDAAQSTATLQMQELRADDGQVDAVQCTATLQMQERVGDDGQGHAAQSTATLQMQELTEGHGQGDAVQCIATLQMQELRADDVQGDAGQCATTLQRQELTADVGQGNAAQCTATLPMQGLGADDGQGDVAQCTMALQRQELTADDGLGDAAQFTPTLPRQELTADDGQGDAVPCTTTLQRQQLSADDGQDAVAPCITALPRQKSISDGAQGDVARCTTALQRQESDAAHGKGSASQCTVLHRQEFLAADDGMQEAVHFRNSAEAMTSLSSTQEGSDKVTGFLNTSYGLTAEPVPRQFWKAGEYGLASQAAINNGQNHLRIHPKFLHSNATSHKWAFGDNGGGMSPESLRYCMSFGFSQKCTTASIGQYGNGFKTSTMRLGADAVLFTCTKDNRRLTRSVGLLSYTFLMRTKCNDIFVPAVDYEFDASSSTFKRIMNCGEKHFSSNLSTLLRWSPFSTEGELLNQDIMISGAPEVRARCNTVERLTQMHVANRFRYSLRVYASILYLHVPESFQIILCGRAVEPHYAVNDLIYRECIKYRPQVEVTTEVDVITTIGYLKGAPRLDIYGFNVYHKNRLILIAKRPPPAHYVSTTADNDDHNLVAQATTNPCDYNSCARASVALRPCSNGYHMRYPLHVDLGALTDQMDHDACPSTSINVGTTSYIPRNAPQESQTGWFHFISSPLFTFDIFLINVLEAELHKRRKSCSGIFWRAEKRRNTNVYYDHPGSNNGTEEAEEGFRVVLDQNTMLKSE